MSRTQTSGSVSIEAVRSFWDANPLCASLIPYAAGTREYFAYYDRLREKIEDFRFSRALHEYARFKGKKVLDVGCGNGYVLARYAQAGANVFGIDLTPKAIELCISRFRQLCLSGNFREGNAEQLPFESDSFDCVCSMGVLHHVPDTRAAVAEIRRVLRPGGRLIVMFYHKNSALYRFRYAIDSRILGKSREQLVNEFDGIGNPKGTVFTKEELGELLQGFIDLHMFTKFLDGSMFFPFGGRLIPVSLLRPFERWLGWNLYAKGYKGVCL